MKRLILIGAGVVLLSGAAWAQNAQTMSPPPPPPPMQDGIKAAPPPASAQLGGPPDQGVGARPPAGPDGRRPPPPGDMADEGPDGPPPGGPRGHRPPPPKGAHFRLERGDLAVDIKCADDEPMKACADVAMSLIDKLQSAAKL